MASYSFLLQSASPCGCSCWCCLCCVLCAVQYEPELFPGLIYRMKEPKIVLLIFVSGKVVLTGALTGCSRRAVSVCRAEQAVV